MGRGGSLHPALHAGAAVIRQREGLATQQATQALDLGGARRNELDVQVGAQGAQRGQVLFIVRVVDEGAQKHAVALQQMAQQVVRTYLVALVGRVRQAVHEVEQVRHGVTAQPRLRTMWGPSQLARPSGMRRQVAINSLYLALAGLFCGMLSRL